MLHLLDFCYILTLSCIFCCPQRRDTAILYISRKLGGRGLKSVENEYKNTKIKAAVQLYYNANPTMAAVRSFEEPAVQNRRHSIIKDAKKYKQRSWICSCG